MSINCTYTYKNKTYSLDRLRRMLVEELPIRNQARSIQFLQDFLGMTEEEVLIVKGLIDNKSLGRFRSDGKILLSELADINVAYHEAFHKVWRSYFSLEERALVISEFKRKHNNWQELISSYKNYETELDKIEEYFADEFADYVQNKDYKTFQPLKSFFSRLVNFIKKILGLSTKDISTIYERIYNKEFKNKKALYSTQDVDLQIQGETFSVLEKNEIVSKLTQSFLKEILTRNGDIDNFLTNKNVSKINDILKMVSGNIAKSILDTNGKEQALAFVKDINEYYQFNKPSYFVEKLKNNLKQIGFVVNEVDIESQLDEDSIKSREFIESVQFDPTSSMSTKIKILLSSMNTSEKTNVYKFEKPLSYKQTFVEIATRMVGIPTSEFMNELEKQNLPYIPNLVSILNSSVQLRNEFIRTMALTQNNFYIMQYSDGDIYFYDANSGTKETKIIKDWESSLVKKFQDYEKWKKDFFVLHNNLAKIPTDKLLEHLGITLNENVSDYKHLVYLMYDEINKKLQDPEFNISQNKPFSKKSFNIEGYVEKLAKKQALYTNQQDFMVFLNNKKLYSLGLNTQQSQLINSINYAQSKFTNGMSMNEKIEILKKYAPFAVSEFNLTKTNTGYKIHNKWLQKILSDERLKINIVYNVKNSQNDVEDVSKLSEPDLYAYHINGVLQGIQPSMKHADRSTFYSYSFSRKPLYDKESVGNIDTGLDLLTDIFAEQIVLEAKLKKQLKGSSVQNIEKNFSKPIFGSLIDNFETILETGKVEDTKKIKDFLKEKFNNFKNEVLNYKIDQGGISKSLLQEYGSLDAVLINAFVNEIAGHIYESRLFHGDNRVFKNGNDLFKRLSPQSSTGNLPVTDKFTENYIRESLNKEHDIVNPITQEIEKVNTASKLIDSHFRSITLAEKETYKSYLLEEGGISKITGKSESKLFLAYEFNYEKDGLLTTKEQKDQFVKKIRLYESKYSNINENDGQSYMSLPAFKSYMIRQGQWSDGMELVYQIEMQIAGMTELDPNITISINGETFNPFVLNGKDTFKQRTVNGKTIKLDALHTLKTQFAGYSLPEIYFNSKEELFNSVYKTSQHILLPSNIIGTNLQLMNYSMLKNGIDIIHMGSANKVGGVDAKQAAKNQEETSEILEDIKERGLDFYDKDGYFNDKAISENINILSYLSKWENLKDQVKIGNKVKDIIKGSTQSLKIIPSNLIINGVERFESAQTLVDKYKKVIKDLVEAKKEVTLKELGYDVDLSEFKNLDTLKRAILESSQLADAPDNIKNSIENFFADPSLGLETAPFKNKIENVLYSLISNGIISFDRSGSSYPQAAITGYEKLGSRKFIDGVQISNQDTLKFYEPIFNENGEVIKVKPAEIIIPLPDYWIKPMLKKYNTNNIVVALKLLNEDINKRPELYQIKGLRIPNQQLSSNDFFQIKEFKLPTMQNYVLVPSEIVVKVGSDSLLKFD